MQRSNLVIPVSAIVTAVLALGACSASDDQGTEATTSPTASATTSTTVTSTPAPSTATHTAIATVTTTPNAAASSSKSSNSSAGNGTSACAESQLRASVEAQTVSGTGRHVVRIIIANKSGSSCTLSGYPGAAIVDSSGKQVQQAKRVTGGPIGGTIEKSATLTVKPGSSAFAYLEGASTRETGAAQAGCDGAKYPRILVTPPNTKTAVPFTIGWPRCYGFNVHPMRLQ